MSDEFNKMSAMSMLSALGSRLTHLQSTRYSEESSNIQGVDTHSENAKNGWVAEWILSYLMDRVLEGQSGYVSTQHIAQLIQQERPEINEERVRFIARFLSVDCEFHFVNESFSPVSSRSLTKLIDYQARSDRVKLTKAGRLVHRVTNLQQDWLYEDKNVEKVLRALKNGEFSRIPSLAAEITATIGLASAEITEIREHASYQEVAQAYFKQREQFSETIQLCLEAAHKCFEFLDSREARSRMAIFIQEQGADSIMSIKLLKDVIVEICSACESLSRNFTSLIKLMQNDKTPRLGILNFNEVIDQFICSSVSEDGLRSVINDCFGWMPKTDTFSSLDLEERLSITPLQNKPLTVRYRPGDRSKVKSWIEKNKEKLISHLKDSPKSIVELLEIISFSGSDIKVQDVTEFFLVTNDPVKLSENLSLGFLFAQDMQCMQAQDYRVWASNIKLRLCEENV